MKIIIITLLLTAAMRGEAQMPKANTITVSGVAFNEVVERLLDAGYI